MNKKQIDLQDILYQKIKSNTKKRLDQINNKNKSKKILKQQTIYLKNEDLIIEDIKNNKNIYYIKKHLNDLFRCQSNIDLLYSIILAWQKVDVKDVQIRNKIQEAACLLYKELKQDKQLLEDKIISSKINKYIQNDIIIKKSHNVNNTIYDKLFDIYKKYNKKKMNKENKQMKLTKKQLQQMIQEQVKNTLKEQSNQINEGLLEEVIKQFIIKIIYSKDVYRKLVDRSIYLYNQNAFEANQPEIDETQEILKIIDNILKKLIQWN